LPANYFTIDRNGLAWADNHRRTSLNLGDRDDGFRPIALHTGRLRSKGRELLHRSTGSLGCKVFGVITDAHEEYNHHCRRPLPNN